MRLRLLCLGTRMPRWVEQGVAEYRQRMPRDCALEVREFAATPRRGNADTSALRGADSRILDRACRPGERRIVLDERGSAWTTRQLSEQLADWRMQGGDVALLIGGPDGHDDTLRDSAASCWSLSPLTLPHALVRVLVAEQLYRAWTILQGHPYHRE